MLLQVFRGLGTRREAKGDGDDWDQTQPITRQQTWGPNGSKIGTRGPMHISSSSRESTIAHCVSKSKVATSLMRKQRRRGLRMCRCPWRVERKTLTRGCRKAASASFCVHCKARASVRSGNCASGAVRGHHWPEQLHNAPRTPRLVISRRAEVGCGRRHDAIQTLRV